jgi:hypothetical protein
MTTTPPPPPEGRVPDEEAVPDAAAPTPQSPPFQGTPWERRDQIGMVAAAWDTTVAVLSSPSRFFAGVKAGPGVGGELVYGTILGYLGVLASAVYSQVISLVPGALGGLQPRSRFGALPTFAEGWLVFALEVVLGPVLVLMGIFFSAAVSHLGLLLVGQSRGFEMTLKVFCYAQAVAVFQLLPICGGLLSLPYLVTLYVIGLATTHEIPEGRAYAALLLTFLAVCCCVGALVFGFVGVAGLAGLQSGLR